MRNFIDNWNLKKHIAAETMFYSSIGLVGNAFFKKQDVKNDKKSCPIEACSNMPKKQKMFNSVLLGCFAFDLLAGYCLLKGLKKLLNNRSAK